MTRMKGNPIEFSRTVDGMELTARYSPKDFTIEYDHPRYGLFSYGAHLPYPMPRTYSKEDVEARLPGAASVFKEAVAWLDENPRALDEIFREEKAVAAKIKDALSAIELEKQTLRNKLKDGLIEKSECRRQTGKLKAEQQKMLYEIESRRKDAIFKAAGEERSLSNILEDIYQRRYVPLLEALHTTSAKNL